MQIAEAAQDMRQVRTEAIADVIDRVREIEHTRGVNREALADIRETLLELTRHPELFPAADFPPGKDTHGFDAVYRLSQDEDHRFALYMSTSSAGKRVPPHDHTTWAVIVGIQGEELNAFYERTDDGSQPGKGILREVRRETVRLGTGVCLMPDDIHHIETEDGNHTMHLHLYGLALEQLTQRVAYDMNAGTYKQMNVTPHVIEAR